jgi:predicted ATP-grasp superfamily ATP-dependent carboligase
MNELVVIVNPARDHYDVVREVFNNYTYKILILWSSEEDKNTIHNKYRKDDTSFHYEEVYTKEVIDRYAQTHKIIACIPSGDDSVDLALKLQNRYVPKKSNSLETIDIIKDKELYLNLLREKGIVTTRQYSLNNIEEYPVVVKPKESRGGSENVYYVNSLSSLPSLNSNDYIAQEYIDGPEYTIDIATASGEHHLLLATEYSKKHGSLWQYKESVMNYTENRYFIDELYEYVCLCLDALNWNFGVTCAQVIVDEKHKIHLVEINFRKHGHISDHGVYLSSGIKLSTHVSNLYLNTDKFKNRISYYDYNQPYERFWVNVESSKYIESINWPMLEEIPSFIGKIDHNILFNLPKKVNPSTSMLSSLGMVSLSNSDLVQYDKDIEAYNNWWNTYK